MKINSHWLIDLNVKAESTMSRRQHMHVWWSVSQTEWNMLRLIERADQRISNSEFYLSKIMLAITKDKWCAVEKHLLNILFIYSILIRIYMGKRPMFTHIFKIIYKTATLKWAQVIIRYLMKHALQINTRPDINISYRGNKIKVTWGWEYGLIGKMFMSKHNSKHACKMDESGVTCL